MFTLGSLNSQGTTPGALLLAFALSLTLLSCGQVNLESIDADSLKPFAKAVSRERVEDLVHDLVAAHQSDEPIDCTLFGGELSYEPDCHLSRDKARDLVKARFESYGYTLKTQKKSGPVLASENVFVEIPGQSKKKEVVLIGAHFDAFYAGADDNSSGMAVVLEAARVLAGHKFKRTLRFIGFDLEEVGLVGSSRYVESLGGEEVVATIILDSVGYTSSEPDSQTSIPGLPAPSVGDFLAVFASELSSAHARQVQAMNEELDLLKIATILAPGDGAYPLVGNLLRSDHAPFWISGRPALFFTDTANFRNPHYHTKNDTIETLDFKFLTQVARLSVVSLVHWAELESTGGAEGPDNSEAPDVSEGSQ